MSLPNEIAIAEQYHALLENSHHGTLSTIRHNDGLISSNPVGFVWDGIAIRISTLKNRMKYKNLVADPRVTFCVIAPRNITEYVEIRGYATVTEDEDRSFFRQQFMAGAGVEPPDDIDPPGSERVVIKIHPQQVSSPKLYGGRFDKAD